MLQLSSNHDYFTTYNITSFRHFVKIISNYFIIVRFLILQTATFSMLVLQFNRLYFFGGFPKKEALTSRAKIRILQVPIGA